MATATLAPERWLTRAEAAELLKLKPQTLAKWAMDGRNLRFSKRGRLVRYRLSDVLAYLEGGMVGSDAAQ
jgi:excisionase family DNA binding protein